GGGGTAIERLGARREVLRPGSVRTRLAAVPADGVDERWASRRPLARDRGAGAALLPGAAFEDVRPGAAYRRVDAGTRGRPVSAGALEPGRARLPALDGHGRRDFVAAGDGQSGPGTLDIPHRALGELARRHHAGRRPPRQPAGERDRRRAVTRGLGLRAEIVAVSALLAGEGVLFSRNLDARATYDEGVYLASLDALRHGQALGTDVFGSQPPGFYTLLRLVGLAGGSSITDLRLGFLAVALVGCLGAYLAGRLLLGVVAGVAASALVAITPSFASEAPRVSADVPSVALALAALALAVAALRRRAPLWLAGATGAGAAGAVSVKLYAVTVVVPLAALAVVRRASRRQVGVALAGAAVVAAALAAGYAGALGSIWQQAFSFHTNARDFGGGEPNGHAVAHFLDFRTPSGWLVAGGAAASLLVRRVWPFWPWVGACVLLLLLQKPLFEHHLVLLAASVGLAAGLGLGGVV